MNEGSDVQHIAATLTSGLLAAHDLESVGKAGAEKNAKYAVVLYREVLKALRENPEDATGIKVEYRMVDPD